MTLVRAVLTGIIREVDDQDAETLLRQKTPEGRAIWEQVTENAPTRGRNASPRRGRKENP